MVGDGDDYEMNILRTNDEAHERTMHITGVGNALEEHGYIGARLGFGVFIETLGLFCESIRSSE